MPGTRWIDGVRGLALAVVLCLTGCGREVALPDGFTPEGPIDCRLEFASTEASLLQPIQATLWIYVEADTAPGWPETPIPSGFLGEVDARGDAPSRPYGDGFLLRRSWTLRPTRLGEVTFPSLPLEVAGHKTSTPEQVITVRSVLRTSDDETVLEDPAAPFEPQFRWGLWSGLLAGALALALGAVLFLRARRRRPQQMPVEVPVLPHVKAMRALARLRQAERTTATEIEAFYVGVSQVLRDYFEERFGLHAPQRSTEEFLLEIERSHDLNHAQRQRLRQFLQQCDLVKFARVIPGEETHEQTLRIAESVVEETRADGEGAGGEPTATAESLAGSAASAGGAA